MVNISNEVINVVKQYSERLLERRTLGGVTSDSATNAIETGIRNIANKANEILGNAQREILQLRQQAELTAQKIAELTTEKDSVTIRATSLEEKLAQAEKQIKEIKTQKFGIKVGKPRTLPNGNIETIKINKNGTRMTTETLPDGRKVSVTVETLDGLKRKTFYNPSTGKPIRTFTNVDGDRNIRYDAEGIATSNKRINVKKAKQKPTVVANEVLSIEKGIVTTKKTFSDGSYEILKINDFSKQPINRQLFNGEKKLIEEAEYKYMDEKIYTTLKKYDPETGKLKSILEETDFGTYKTSIEKKVTERRETYEEIRKTKDGLTQIVRAKVDEFGNVDASNTTVKIIYPKTSKIKSSDIEFISRYFPEKETLHMRDGSTVVISRINSNYYPTRLEIYKKGATEPAIIEKSDGIKSYLEEIGKAYYVPDGYYNNYLDKVYR
ncbi:hypothetical protein IJ579_04510 [bacterium]|nr:hypothetical protein [bacterium]